MVSRGLARAGRDDLTETAELLISEVVTNALVHAGTPIDVAFSVTAGGLRVDVGDGSPHLPLRRSYGATAGTGRGLMLLEKMVDDWGVVPSRHGKTVWFSLVADRSQGGPASTGTASALADRGDETVAVQLLNVPLLLHAAWTQHAESLLREYLLSRLDSEPGADPVHSSADPIQEHAEASDALALLAEHIPAPDLGEDPDRLMGAATEPNVSCPRVDVSIPVRSLPHFHTLNRTLEEAFAIAESGTFLTAPAQPELRLLRAWICHQIFDQGTGMAPTPWSAEDQPPPRPPHLLEWDHRPVTESHEAVIASDDTDEIIAASRHALDLLGYDDEAQLVGERIVAIIPVRYRQAHLAGFTLHFLTGRSPLLGRPVIVPVKRRDGTEAATELTVRAQRVPNGRSVFLAELRHPTG